jgi:hypothetical protein
MALYLPGLDREQKGTPMDTAKWVTRHGDRRLEREATQIGEWDPTVVQMRDAIQDGRICAIDFGEMMQLQPRGHSYRVKQDEVELANVMALEAVTAGRVIDFGFLPNAVLKHGGNRGGPLWNISALPMPFQEPWILYHRWEGQTGIYLINPSAHADAFEVVELQPAAVDGDKVLLIGDRGEFHKVAGELPDKRYDALMVPSAARFAASAEDRQRINNGGTPEAAAAGNVGDPVMTALLIFNTRNVERETVRAPEKLQKARRRSGKPLIPDYDRINAAPYVTAITLRSAPYRGEGKGGTHRSPVPHIRLGHPRTYSTGRSIFIRDTLVNVPADRREEFKSSRSHYVVKP